MYADSQEHEINMQNRDEVIDGHGSVSHPARLTSMTTRRHTVKLAGSMCQSEVTMPLHSLFQYWSWVYSFKLFTDSKGWVSLQKSTAFAVLLPLSSRNYKIKLYFYCAKNWKKRHSYFQEHIKCSCKVGMYRYKTFAVDSSRDQREQWWATAERSKRSLSHEVASKAYELGEIFIMLTH